MLFLFGVVYCILAIGMIGGCCYRSMSIDISKEAKMMLIVIMVFHVLELIVGVLATFSATTPRWYYRLYWNPFFPIFAAAKYVFTLLHACVVIVLGGLIFKGAPGPSTKIMYAAIAGYNLLFVAVLYMMMKSLYSIFHNRYCLFREVEEKEEEIEIESQNFMQIKQEAPVFSILPYQGI